MVVSTSVFAEFDAKVCWRFFLGHWLSADGEMKLLFDVGEGGGHCLLTVEVNTPV